MMMMCTYVYVPGEAGMTWRMSKRREEKEKERDKENEVELE